MLKIIFIISLLLSSQAYAYLNLHCATNTFAPFGFIENGQLKGVEVEVLKEIAKRLHITMDIKLLAWEDMLEAMEKGEIDCMFAAFKTPKRMEYMDYTTLPIHISSISFFKNQYDSFNFIELNDLKDKKVAIVKGFTVSDDFQQAAQQNKFTLIEVFDIESAFRTLDNKYADLVVVNRDVGAYTLKNMQLQDITSIPTPVTAQSAYITFSKKRNLSFLIPHFDTVLFKILTDGTYQTIYEKYTK